MLKEAQVGEHPLNHPNRVLLYQLLTTSPGMNRSQLQETSGLSNGVMSFHLQVLERAGHVVQLPSANDKEVLLFTRENQGLWNDVHTRVLLGGGSTREVALAVARKPGITSAEIGELLNLQPVSVRYHLGKLQKSTLATCFRLGNEVRYMPTDKLRSWTETFQERFSFPPGPGER